MAYFLAKTGNDMNNIKNEADKIIAYTGAADEITMEDIDWIVANNTRADNENWIHNIKQEILDSPEIKSKLPDNLVQERAVDSWHHNLKDKYNMDDKLVGYVDDAIAEIDTRLANGENLSAEDIDWIIMNNTRSDNEYWLAKVRDDILASPTLDKYRSTSSSSNYGKLFPAGSTNVSSAINGIKSVDVYSQKSMEKLDRTLN